MPRSIATNTTVDRAELVEFLRPRHRVILLTPRTDGGWQGSPVTSGVDADGRIVISTYPERAKAATSRGTGGPPCWPCPTTSTARGCRSRAPPSCSRLPEALEPLVEYFRCHLRRAPGLGRVPGRDDRAGQGTDPDHPERWGPIATGGFPARLG